MIGNYDTVLPAGITGSIPYQHLSSHHLPLLRILAKSGATSFDNSSGGDGKSDRRMRKAQLVMLLLARGKENRRWMGVQLRRQSSSSCSSLSLGNWPDCDTLLATEGRLLSMCDQFTSTQRDMMRQTVNTSSRKSHHSFSLSSLSLSPGCVVPYLLLWRRSKSSISFLEKGRTTWKFHVPLQATNIDQRELDFDSSCALETLHFIACVPLLSTTQLPLD